MVGIVLVSHSRPLALSVQKLVRAMTGPALPLAIAAGAGDKHAELGTDAVEISEAIATVHSPDGVVLLMDMGSAILSAETALDLLDPHLRRPIRLCPAPFVEGAVAAGVTANLGASLDEVCREALAALNQKMIALTSASAPGASQERKADDSMPAAARKVTLTVPNLHGLHARPAARLITEMRSFRSEITVSNLSNQRGPASIRSLSSLAALEILRGHKIEVSACGDDVQAALKKITELVESGLGEVLPTAGKKIVPEVKSDEDDDEEISVAAPVPISGGIAIARGVYFKESKLDIPSHKVDDVSEEIERLRKAVFSVQEALQLRRDQMKVSVGAVTAEIYDAQLIALQDPELVDHAEQIIRTEQANAAQAWDRANRQIVQSYETLQDDYLRERAADLEDIGRQVLELLAVKKSVGPALAEPSILIADNLTPFQVSTLPRKLTLGVILLDGGPTAHSSILLKALGIPAVVQARRVFVGMDWTRPGIVALDGTDGKIWLNPDGALSNELKTRQVEERRRAEEEREASSRDGATLDGHRIEIFANIGQVAEIEDSRHCGAEGIGLLRTEFLFLDRESAPDEEEQFRALKTVAEKMRGKPVIVRTLDAGGDKELPYLQLSSEENPFLGVRAIRLSFSHEEMFATQLRAILRAGLGHDFRIMFPMIANDSDLSRARGCLEKVHLDLEKENIPHLWPIQTGIMIEIPSAALQAEALARHVDFFSIGTNDLTQYTLAADRGNPELATYQDALHPAVLRLIDMVVSGARKHERVVAVCGEAASDIMAAAIFIGLGVRELSMASSKIPKLKAMLGRHTLADLQRLAHTALHCHTATEVRALPAA
jgi:phosphoenolpyruvate-protein phosphotransferase/dihydroxyacetone kinase phosphotransfer subunit